ncbi:MAG: DUF1045 domain-containing protein [Herminiimonas sp.]|nr:DUF1045 domain-containing protein [Herminiimonas sp.]
MASDPLPDTARYALYFAPKPDSPWWRAGCGWLGRDAADGTDCPQPAILGVSPADQRKITAAAARYGFHATVKAPFRLVAGAVEADLLALATRFAVTQPVVPLPELAVRPLGNFLALQLPSGSASAEAVAGLAMRAVEQFDVLRAPAAPAELLRRRRSLLTARQDALLARWGYPYTEEEFRLHFTLTDDMVSLAPDARQAVRDAAERWFAASLAGIPLIDGLTIFREAGPGQPFRILQRFAFTITAASAT